MVRNVWVLHIIDPDPALFTSPVVFAKKKDAIDYAICTLIRGEQITPWKAMELETIEDVNKVVQENGLDGWSIEFNLTSTRLLGRGEIDFIKIKDVPDA